MSELMVEFIVVRRLVQAIPNQAGKVAQPEVGRMGTGGDLGGCELRGGGVGGANNGEWGGSAQEQEAHQGDQKGRGAGVGRQPTTPALDQQAGEAGEGGEELSPPGGDHELHPAHLQGEDEQAAGPQEGP